MKYDKEVLQKALQEIKQWFGHSTSPGWMEVGGEGTYDLIGLDEFGDPIEIINQLVQEGFLRTRMLTEEEVRSNVGEGVEPFEVFELTNKKIGDSNMIKLKAKLKVNDGKKVIGGDGLFTNLQYSTTGEYWGWSLLGFTYRYVANGGVIDYVDLILDCDIPENFTVDTAYIILDTTAINGTYYDGDVSGDVTGYPKQLKLYKGSNYSTFSLYYQYGSDYWYDGSSLSLTEIENAFGDESYTPEESYAGGINTIRTVDISNEIEGGTRNQFVVRTAMNKPSNIQNAISNTGIGRMTLNIFGYMSNEEVE